MSDLSVWLSRDALEDYAGDVIYQRGAAYFHQGAVSRLRDSGSKVSARVHGSENYQVALWTDDAEFQYDCTCPHAMEGNFCKHCVAVGLAFLDGREKGYQPGSMEDEESQIRQYLALQPPETLIDWLLEAAESDDALFRKLLLKAKKASGAVDIVQTFRQEIDKATRTHGYMDYDEAAEFAEELGQLVDALEELQTPESAALVVELAEYAIERIDRVMDQTEDSEGEVYSVLERLQEMHREICESTKPDPVLLAERLFRYEVQEGVDVFYNCMEEYRDVLGPSGLRRFQELVEAAWAKLPSVNAHGGRDGFDTQRWRLSRLMESFAQSSGDIEALVAIKSRDLSSEQRYLEIAKLYHDAGQAVKALDWAERGLEELPNTIPNNLRDFAIAEYLKQGRTNEAVELAWIQFAEQPTLAFYQKLHHIAEPLGLWAEQRERALAHLEIVTQRRGITTRSQYPNRPVQIDYSERVRIALWEKDLETAWQAVQNGACRLELRLTVADAIAQSRPDDALTQYQTAAAYYVEQTNNEAYGQAFNLIRKAQGLMPTETFGTYLSGLRVRYKTKRNFIKLLDSLGQPGR